MFSYPQPLEEMDALYRGLWVSSGTLAQAVNCHAFSSFLVVTSWLVETYLSAPALGLDAQVLRA